MTHKQIFWLSNILAVLAMVTTVAWQNWPMAETKPASLPEATAESSTFWLAPDSTIDTSGIVWMAAATTGTPKFSVSASIPNVVLTSPATFVVSGSETQTLTRLANDASDTLAANATATILIKR